MPRSICFKIFTAILFITIFARAYAGTVTGQIQTASSGKGVANGTLTFTLSQPAVVSGTATVVTSPVNCYTDVAGNVVGLPNPQSAPVLSSNSGSGTLPAGSYYVRYTWANSSGETVSSTEAVRATTVTGTLIVQSPANPPVNATQWKIYISTTPGSETLQTTQAAPFTNYSQSTPLSAGAAMPAANTSVCNLRFNDELQPTYTGYNVTLATASGATVPGFPEKWYLSGGSAGTVNVGAGLPLYNGVVVYPQPVLTTPTNNAQQSISGPLNLNGFKLTTSNVNGFFYVDGTNYTTVQQAITAACAAGGGTVFIPSGTYVQNSPFTLCSNLNLIGAGRAQADATSCPTTITTTMTSGDLFSIVNMTDIHMSDFCIKNTAAAGANAVIRLNYGQRVVAERLYIQGPFAKGIELDSSSTSTGSTIWNDFRDIHITGIAPNGIGCLFDSSDATIKVINNNYFWNVSCIGGTNGVGLKMTNSNSAQVINENIIASGELLAVSGTGILITAGATRGVVLVDPNIEGSAIGFNKAISNVVTTVGGNISSNTTDVSDAQPSFTSFINTHVGGVVQFFAIDPSGGISANGFAFGSGTPTANEINGGTGWCLAVSGTCIVTINSSSLQLSKAINNNEIAAPAGTTGQGLLWADSAAHKLKANNNNGGAVTLAYTDLAQIFTASQTQGSNGVAVSIHQHKRISTGSIGSSTRTEVLLTWANTMNDTNYSVTCNIEDSTTAAGSQGLTFERVRTKSATQIGAVINNPTGGAITGTLDCTADHD